MRTESRRICFVAITVFFLGLLAAWYFNRSRVTPQTDAAITSVLVEVERLDRTVQLIDKAVKKEVQSHGKEAIPSVDVSVVVDELVRAFRKSRDNL